LNGPYITAQATPADGRPVPLVTSYTTTMADSPTNAIPALIAKTPDHPGW
jgi:hypothetical protein